VTHALGVALFSIDSGSGSIWAILTTSLHALRTISSVTAALDTPGIPARNRKTAKKHTACFFTGNHFLSLRVLYSPLCRASRENASAHLTAYLYNKTRAADKRAARVTHK
jgi:hypothetical protein